MEQTNKSEILGNQFINSNYGMLYLTKNVAGTVWVADNIFSNINKAGLTIAPEENPFTGTNSTTSWVTDLKTCSNTFTDCFIGIAGSNSIVDQGNSSVAAGNFFSGSVKMDVFSDQNGTSGLTYYYLVPLVNNSINNNGFIFNLNSSLSLPNSIYDFPISGSILCDYSKPVLYKVGKPIDSEVKFDTYPNPVNNQINVQLTSLNSNDFTISILDVTGKVIFSKSCVNNLQNYVFNTECLKGGLYMIQLLSSNGILKTNKFIKINE